MYTSQYALTLTQFEYLAPKIVRMVFSQIL